MSSSAKFRFLATSSAPYSQSAAAMATGQNAGTLVSDRLEALTTGVFDMGNPCARSVGSGARWSTTASTDGTCACKNRQLIGECTPVGRPSFATADIGGKVRIIREQARCF